MVQLRGDPNKKNRRMHTSYVDILKKNAARLPLATGREKGKCRQASATRKPITVRLQVFFFLCFHL
jgi:hypothetical protein